MFGVIAWFSVGSGKIKVMDANDNKWNIKISIHNITSYTVQWMWIVPSCESFWSLSIGKSAKIIIINIINFVVAFKKVDKAGFLWCAISLGKSCFILMETESKLYSKIR